MKAGRCATQKYMINRIIELAAGFGAMDQARTAKDEKVAEETKRLAAAVLMVEAAKMDGHFDDSEAKTISQIVQARFGLSREEAAELIEAARETQEESNHLLKFTRAIKDHFPAEDRINIIEMLWEVAYADGILHPFEANLMRRVAGLIYVSDQESGASRKRVIKRRGIEG